MNDNFKLHGQYYDLLYAEKDYQRESLYVAERLRNMTNVRTLLELGSGTGNHAQYLCNDGFIITGIERSPEMVGAATAKHIQGFTSKIGDISSFDLNATYDAVISLFHVIGYLNTNQELISCFRSVNKHLRRGGIFLFDVWYSPAVYKQQPETRIKRLSGSDIEITRIAEPRMRHQANVVDVNYEIMIRNCKGINKSIHETHTMRHFSIPEIDMLARISGFEFIKAEEFMTGLLPSENTWGVTFILKKNE